MGDRDLYGRGQMFEAIRLDGPRRVTSEDVADPGLLGTGEHGTAMVSERAEGGQRGGLTPPLGRLGLAPDGVHVVEDVERRGSKSPSDYFDVRPRHPVNRLG